MAEFRLEAPQHTSPAIHRLTSSDGHTRVALRAVAELLASLEQQIQVAQTVVEQLATQLDGQRECLPDARRAVLSLPHLLAPTSSATSSATDLADADGLRLFCLGPFEVRLGQEGIPQRRNGKGRAILKFLAARPRQPVLRDVLLETLWPEEDPEVANNRLRVAMHHLRQVCVASDGEPERGEMVIFRDGCYMFNPMIRVWTDVEAFDAAWKAGARLERSGHLAQAIPFYESAETLYRGDYFEDDCFEDWMLVRREELKETYLRVLGKLSHYWLDQGALESAIDGWKKILVKDPWREDVYRHLMVSFAKNGQRGVALHWYDLCAHVLQKELHLDPESETIELYGRIRRGEAVQVVPTP